MIADALREIGGWPVYGVATAAFLLAALLDGIGTVGLALAYRFTDMLSRKRQALSAVMALAGAAIAFAALSLLVPNHALAAAGGAFGYFALSRAQSWAQT